MSVRVVQIIIQFTVTEPWTTLRGSASEPPAIELWKNMKRKNCNHHKPDHSSLADHGDANGGRPLAQGERTTGASAQPPAPGEQAEGEQAEGEQAQGEQAQGEQAPTWTTMQASYCVTYHKSAAILKRAVELRNEWHIDLAIMGQKTFGLNGEAYSIVVLDVGSNLGAVINTRTREDPWQHFL
jgi:hypothetical protein